MHWKIAVLVALILGSTGCATSQTSDSEVAPTATTLQSSKASPSTQSSAKAKTNRAVSPPPPSPDDGISPEERAFLDVMDSFSEAFMELNTATGGLRADVTMEETDPILAKSAFEKFGQVAEQGRLLGTFGDPAEDEAWDAFLDLLEMASKDGLEAYTSQELSSYNFTSAIVGIVVAVSGLSSLGVP